MYKRTSSILGTLVAAVALLAMSASAQGGITSIHLGASTSQNGIVFTGGSGTGNLTVDIGGCPLISSLSCVSGGNVTGSVSVGGGANYSLSADLLTASFLSTAPSGVDSWSLSPSADAFTLALPSYFGAFGGTINWTEIVENTSGVSLIGDVSYTGSGSFTGDNGSINIGVLLAPLSCNFTPSSANPCTLANISGELGDPPAAFSSVGSGSFSNTPPVVGATPEPGSLLLLGTGLLGVAPFIRRRFARA